MVIHRYTANLIELSIAVITVVSIPLPLLFGKRAGITVAFILTSGGAIAIAVGCAGITRDRAVRSSVSDAGAPRVIVRVHVDVTKFIFCIVLAISRSSDLSLLLNHKHGGQPKKTAVSIFRLYVETPCVRWRRERSWGYASRRAPIWKQWRPCVLSRSCFKSALVSRRGRLDMPD